MLHKRTIIILTLLLLVGDLSTVCYGQTVLSLDSCRAMALRNNKQMRVAELRRNMAAWRLMFAGRPALNICRTSVPWEPTSIPAAKYPC